MFLVHYHLGCLPEFHFLLWQKGRHKNDVEVFAGQIVGLDDKTKLFDIIVGISSKGSHKARDVRKIQKGKRDVNPDHTLRTGHLAEG